MTVDLDVLEAQVMKLPAADRARLLERLIVSLDDDAARDQAWDRLAADRDAAIERGEVQELDGPEVLNKLRAKLV